MRKPQQLPEWPASDAMLAALLFAVDPHGLGGVVLRGMPGPFRDEWLKRVRALLPSAMPWQKVPLSVSDDRLLGGLDFAATIASGKPIHTTGLLQSADDGVVVLAMAERLTEMTAAVVTSSLDRGGVQTERDGLSKFEVSRFGVVALDEGIDEDEKLPVGLADRLAFRVDTVASRMDDLDPGRWTFSDVQAARRRLTTIAMPVEVIAPVCQATIAFGIASLRAEVLTLRAARAAAALANLDKVDEGLAALAARLVLAHRAARLPQAEPEAEDIPDESPESRDEQNADATADSPSDDADPDESNKTPNQQKPPDELLVDAVQASIPPGLLSLLQQQGVSRQRQSGGGRGESKTRSRRRGRPVGVKPADAAMGQRLNVLATLKAAAPWQSLRRRDAGHRGKQSANALHIRQEDMHVTRFQERVETTIIFAVDASGSQAAQRLAEVKGAIELLLKDCYVRRDQVSMVSFRGDVAEVMLTPTRSLARAKRLLAALPGGGGTPLADGLDKTSELAESIARQGRIPVIVVLTDGRANIRRDGQPGAERAEEEALQAARQLAIKGFKTMLVDTSRRPRPRAAALAKALNARYLPLPQANASTLSQTVQLGMAA